MRVSNPAKKHGASVMDPSLGEYDSYRSDNENNQEIVEQPEDTAIESV